MLCGCGIGLESLEVISIVTNPLVPMLVLYSSHCCLPTLLFSALLSSSKSCAPTNLLKLSSESGAGLLL
jgi:hypothetical protein